MQQRPLGNTGLHVSPLGFGAFKIGRNQQIKYPAPYDLPDEAAVSRLLHAVLDLGISYIDTASAYGLSEERIGRTIAHRRDEFVSSTKVGESFEESTSIYDFSSIGIRNSVTRSLQRLNTDVLDLVFIHSDGNDALILRETSAVETLLELKTAGLIRAVGFSGKTAEGATLALEWADAIMVEFHLDDRSHEAVIAKAASRGIGVVVKKGLASGHLPPAESISFVLENRSVSSLVVGGLNIDHIRANVDTVNRMDAQSK